MFVILKCKTCNESWSVHISNKVKQEKIGVPMEEQERKEHKELEKQAFRKLMSAGLKCPKCSSREITHVTF